MTEINEAREEAVQAIMLDTGKTREQAEAFLEIVGSAFARRGWIEGEPLLPDAIGERLETFLDRNGEEKPLSELAFKVLRGTRWDTASGGFVPDPGLWAVQVTGHHCCPLDITIDLPHAEAVAALEKFIADAQEALRKLKAQQEMGDDS